MGTSPAPSSSSLSSTLPPRRVLSSSRSAFPHLKSTGVVQTPSPVSQGTVISVRHQLLHGQKDIGRQVQTVSAFIGRVHTTECKPEEL